MNKKATKEKSAAAAVNVRSCEDVDGRWAAKVRDQDVDWFLPFWNQQREVHHSALQAYLFLTKPQIETLKRRQAKWGRKVLRQFVLNLMTSDYVNGRRGKSAPSHIDWFLQKDRFPLVAQGKYNDAPVQERPMTEDERRQLEQERYRAQEAARRAENRAIEEQIRAEERQRRAAMSRGCVTYEQYLAMKNGEGNINLTEI